MNLQYISDNKGKTTGVFIPIHDWKYLKNKYKEIEQEEKETFEIPEWQKQIVSQRLKDYQDNPENVQDW
ncbi:MAG TPA: addiction module component CHP02574 family protein, partial [Prolixibacteraceae bacterium]|nr:addiction module component CHP02574 family protein [Prolixibacteraceae bacterium]